MDKSYYRSIVDTLKSIKRPGIYAAGGKAAMPLPAISLAGEPDTILGLPLGEAQAKQLIELAGRAPHGKGEKAIVDTSICCTWQLNPGQFLINNHEWGKSLHALLDQVKLELGCNTNMSVATELYKLVLYEPGGFFKVRNPLFIHVTQLWLDFIYAVVLSGINSLKSVHFLQYCGTIQ